MSEREHNLGSGESDAEFGAADALAPQKNRPATGAAQVQSPQGLGQNWQGGSAATDFLGLDADLPAAGGFADPVRTGGLVDPTLPAESWLHSIEGSATAVEDGAPDATAEPENLLDALESEAFEPAAEDDPALPPPVPRVRAPRQTRVLTFALAGLLLALLSGGAWMWRQHARRGAVTPATDVAQHSPPKPQANPKTPDRRGGTVTKNTPTPAKDPQGGAVEATNPGASVDTTTPSTEVAPDDVATVPTTDTSVPTPTVEPTIKFPPTLEPAAGLAPVSATTPQPAKVRGSFSTPAASNTPLPGAVRRATDADFAGLWRETSIPREAIDGDVRLRTLNVGRVRVLLVGGDYYEGTLYAVGQRRVWLDLDLGRISFESSTVRELIAIASASGTAANSKQKPEDLVGLPHVEVHLPGGTITGRLVGREGNQVTLVTDKGLRTVLESDDVRPVTMHNTRVLGPVAKLDAQAGPKNP